MDFYQNKEYLNKMMRIINGESKISLRIVDWFVTNFAKKYYTVYELDSEVSHTASEKIRFKVYNDYKLRLKAYSKLNFDPFCRWSRISIPYDENSVMETTIGQLNFFKWAIEHKIVDYIEAHYQDIENDMNNRNSTAKRRGSLTNTEDTGATDMTKTRKKREELSISACKCIKKEVVKIVVKFN
jgi:spore germination protein YaaH